MYVESRVNKELRFSEKLLYDLVYKVVNKQLSSTKIVNLNEDGEKNLEVFYEQLNEKYVRLKESVGRCIMDISSTTIDLTEERVETLKKVRRRLAEEKKNVMSYGFHRLDYEVIEASRTPLRMVNLMYNKRVTSDEFHQIVAGLARWQVLDELQRQLHPIDLASCFAVFQESPHGGRPAGNLYDHVDKERLRDTLENLYFERYHFSVTEGWNVSKEKTRDFLLALMLSLFKNPLTELGGRMAAFGRFFKGYCGYAFAGKRNLQNWIKNYQEFDIERDRRKAALPMAESQKDYNKWMRRLRKFTTVESLSDWIRGLLPQYGICPA